MSVKEEVTKIICEVLDTKEQEIKLEQSLYDSLGVDSTEMVEVRVALKKRLGLDIADSELTNRHTLAQIIELIDKKKNC